MFREQVYAIIEFYGPLADEQRADQLRAEEWQRKELERLRQEQEREAIRLAEVRAKAELLRDQTIATFGSLAEKYGAPANAVVVGTNPSYLVVILQRLEETIVPSDSDCKWLSDNGFYLVIANGYYFLHLKTGDAWALARSGRYYRLAGCPDAILANTGDGVIAVIQDCRARSAVLTNRGGAKRDLSDLQGAESDGLAAVNASPHSFHPHNLLGAIYYQIGQPALGDQYFEKAVTLGATPRHQDSEIRSALKLSSVEARQSVIQHLLTKDPVKYAWVKQYQDFGQAPF